MRSRPHAATTCQLGVPGQMLVRRCAHCRSQLSTRLAYRRRRYKTATQTIAFGNLDSDYFLKSLDSAIAHSPPDRPVQRHWLTTFARAGVDEAPWRQKCPPWAIARNHASTRARPGMFDLQWLLPYTWPAWVLPSGTDAIERISAQRSSAYTTASWRLGAP
jgi:hypothetical protein